jgi:putative phosphoribosyl transferase
MAIKTTQQLVQIPADTATLEGELILPPGASGVVAFAHGSGSSRHSPRNTFVAGVLQAAGLGTLLFDLLTRAEDTDYETRFDIALLTRRLIAATLWLQQQPQTKTLALGYFGASTGAAAALQAAAALGSAIQAVVSRGGRPDLAGSALAQVWAPTLLLVGGEDHGVIELNRRAYAQLPGPKQLVLVPGATHLFEEPGTLEEVARLAAQWFVQYLQAKRGESE